MITKRGKLQEVAVNARPVATIAVALVFALFLARFVAVGWQRMLLNSNSVDGDQGAYLQLGLDMREHGVLSDGTRNPLYPALLASFASREWHYFTFAKLLSLAFGLIGILAVYFTGRSLFDFPTALLAAFLLSINMEFVLHSTFVLAESLLVLCTLCAWFAIVRAIQDPHSALLWGLAGGLVGLAYLAKGSGQLVAVCFVLAALSLHGLRLGGSRGLWVFLAAYGLVALPLWLYNWKTFDSPFFNYATTHQMWMDKWEQGQLRDVKALPTVWSYWQDHTWQEAWARAWKGLTGMRFFVAKMLWPTRSIGLDRFLLSGWSGVVLAIVAGGMVAARHSVWGFARRQREAVTLAAIMGVAFYVLFAWYMAIVPIPIRFMLPILPICLLFLSAGLVGTGRWVIDSPRLPNWSKVAAGAAVLGLVLFVGRWFVLSGLANAQAFRRSPFDADNAFNSHSEQPLLWVRAGHSTGLIGVLVGQASSLPTWRHSDQMRFVRLPIDVETSDDLEAFLGAEKVDYVIVDAKMAQRARTAAINLFGVRAISGDRVSIGTWQPDWALGFAHPEMPCQWCVFRRMTDRPPTHTTSFLLGDAIALAGYDVLADDFEPGDEFVITLFWESLRPVVTDYTVFTQLLGPDRQLYGQVDRQPVHGQWPTSHWLPGQTLVDKFVIPVSGTAPEGDYVLLVGLYDLNTGQRMPVVMDGERVPDDAIALHRLTIEGGNE